MKANYLILKNLKTQGLSNLDIDQIINYLETLEYDISNTRFIGKIVAKNERLAKYFFLRDQFKMKIDSNDESFHINEILDQCIDWNEFWRLLVIKKGFCCIRLSREFSGSNRFIFFSGPNILSGPYADSSESIYEDIDY
tara:strand:+ start:73 stop:489 length:417 start_codon:yes stop_codon:yes gene_type:complete